MPTTVSVQLKKCHSIRLNAQIFSCYRYISAQISDMKQEHERRVETLLDDIKQLTKEMRLQELLINYTIPPEFQELIEKVS